MNARTTIAAQAATIERLKARITELEAEVELAYVALARAAAESWLGRAS
jgi:cell division protein FtsB